MKLTVKKSLHKFAYFPKELSTATGYKKTKRCPSIPSPDIRPG